MTGSFFGMNRLNGEIPGDPSSEKLIRRSQRKHQNDDRKVFNDVSAHLHFLDQVLVTPMSLRFQVNGENASYLEDTFYRENAQIYKSKLKFMFTWFCQFSLVMIEISEIYVYNQVDNDSNIHVHPGLRLNYLKMSKVILALQFVILQSVVLFASRFFQSEDYNTKQYHLVSKHVNRSCRVHTAHVVISL